MTRTPMELHNQYRIIVGFEHSNQKVIDWNLPKLEAENLYSELYKAWFLRFENNRDTDEAKAEKPSMVAEYWDADSVELVLYR